MGDAGKPPEDPDILLRDAAMSDDDQGVISDDCIPATVVALPSQDEVWRQTRNHLLGEDAAEFEGEWRTSGRRRNRGGLHAPYSGNYDSRNRMQSTTDFVSRSNRSGLLNEETSQVLNSAMGRVIIIERLDASDEENKVFLGASVKISKLLKDSPFGIAGIEELTVNWKRKTLSILMRDKTSISELLLIKKLGQYNITCTQPLSHSLVRGVIGPIGMETTMEELQESLGERENQKVTAAERMPKYSGGKKESSLAVKLTFSTEVLPEFVYLGFLRFRVAPYVDRPLQCFKCQGFGHSSKWCGGKEVCLVCAGSHMLKDCPKTNVKCINCGNNHAANYGGCPRMKQAAQVERVRAINKITYSEAIKQVRSREISNQAESTAGTSYQNGSGDSISPEGDANFGRARNVQIISHSVMNRDVGCQTMPTDCSTTQTQALDSGSGEDQIQPTGQHVHPVSFVPDARFCATLIEMANLMTHSQDHRFRCVLTSNLIKKHYGTCVDADKIAAEMSLEEVLSHSKRRLSDASVMSDTPGPEVSSDPKAGVLKVGQSARRAINNKSTAGQSKKPKQGPNYPSGSK